MTYLNKFLSMLFLLSFGLTYSISAMDEIFGFGEVGNGSQVEPKTPPRNATRNTHSSPGGGVQKLGQTRSPKGKGLQLGSPIRNEERLRRPNSSYVPSSSNAPRRSMDQHLEMNSLLKTSPLRPSKTLPFSVDLTPRVLKAPNLDGESVDKVTTEEVPLLRRGMKSPLFLRDDLSDSGFVPSESSQSSLNSRPSQDLLKTSDSRLFENPLQREALNRGTRNSSQVKAQLALRNLDGNPVNRISRPTILPHRTRALDGFNELEDDYETLQTAEYTEEPKDHIFVQQANIYYEMREGASDSRHGTLLGFVDHITWDVRGSGLYLSLGKIGFVYKDENGNCFKDEEGRSLMVLECAPIYSQRTQHHERLQKGVYYLKFEGTQGEPRWLASFKSVFEEPRKAPVRESNQVYTPTKRVRDKK